MKLFRLMGQIHLWLGVAVGVQVMLWLVSGLVMVLWPIETVRGEHLRAPAPVETLDWLDGAPPLAGLIETEGLEGVRQAETGILAGRPVWRLETAGGPAILDAGTGQRLDPVTDTLARSIARARYAGDGALQALTRIDVPPREAGLAGPAWRADFGPEDPATLYINAQTGELRAVRTTLWRVYDWFWGVHIMDWSTRENFNSWWIRATSIIAILFGLAGVVLTVLRLWFMVRARRVRRARAT